MVFFILLLILGTFQDAVELARGRDHEASEKILSEIKPPADEIGKYYYYRMVNAYNTNDKKNTVKWAKVLDDTFEEVPEMYRHIARLVLDDVQYWTDGLDDIGRDMQNVKDRLNNAKVGKGTQKVQKSIVDRLDKMIENLENAELEKAEAQNAKHKIKTKEKNAEAPSSPQDDSYGGDMSGAGEAANKKFKELAGVWGTLPEKERAKALQNLVNEVPPKYKELVQNYFRKLAVER